MAKNKLRVIKDYETLDAEMKKQVNSVYSEGFSQHLVDFTNSKGESIMALPFETEDKIYLIKMSSKKAQNIILNDSSIDDDLNLSDDLEKEADFPDMSYSMEDVEDSSFDE